MIKIYVGLLSMITKFNIIFIDILIYLKLLKNTLYSMKFNFKIEEIT